MNHSKINKMIICNWKMYGRKEDIQKYFNILNLYDGNCKIVVCPPFLYLSEAIKSVKNKQISIGAQSGIAEKDGTKTGCINISMIKNIGCEWIVIGHSEDRKMHNLSIKTINQRIKSSISEKLNVIVCFGESIRGDNLSKVTSRITKTLKNINSGEQKIIIAYEPVWAIGTGTVPTIEEIQTATNEIRNALKNSYHEGIQIVYGGSVNAKNAEAISKINNIIGLMLGRSSLKAEEVIHILKTIK